MTSAFLLFSEQPQFQCAFRTAIHQEQPRELFGHEVAILS